MRKVGESMNPPGEKVLPEMGLVERNHFLESLINLCPDILYIYDIVEKKNVYSNNGVQGILGYSANEIKEFGSDLIAQLMHPEDLQTYLKVTLPKYDNAGEGENIISEYRMKHRLGHWVWLTANETIYQRLPNGKPKQIFGIIHDITERKKMEDTVRESEIQYKSLFQNLDSSFGLYEVVYDEKGEPFDYRILAVNPTYEKAVGDMAADVVGKTLIEAYPKTEKVWLDTLKNVVLTGLPLRFESFSIELGKHIEITVYIPQKGQLGMIATDVSPRKEAELALAEEKQKLDESRQKAQKLESLGVLAGGIAHDFNNLLGGIVGYVDMAKDSLEKNNLETAQESLVKAFDVFGRTKALTQQLLTFAKGGAPIRKVMDLTKLIESSTRFSLSGSNVLSQCEVDPELWLCDCDENQIGQVIDNIVINGQQSMPTGGKIIVRAANIEFNKTSSNDLNRIGKFIRITITDQGMGIPKIILAKIFDPFFTTKAMGHGLGLATVYSIVNRHGGWIDVESELGQGTTFQIFLPASEATSLSSQVAASAIHQGKGRALVMDDEPMIREIAGAMLGSMGYEVALAKDGYEAVGLFAQAHAAGKGFSVTVLDLTIPNGMGGKETASAIRKIDDKAFIIVATGYADDSVMKSPAEFGFSARIAKPYRRSEMAELLQENLVWPRESKAEANRSPEANRSLISS